MRQLRVTASGAAAIDDDRGAIGGAIAMSAEGPKPVAITYGQEVDVPMPAAFHVFAARPADWDGDGRIDLLATPATGGAIYLLKNIGTPKAPRFEFPYAEPPLLGKARGRWTLFDFIDAQYGAQGQKPAREQSRCAKESARRGGELPIGRTFDVADMDGDGDLDFLLARTNQVAWLRNTGSKAKAAWGSPEPIVDQQGKAIAFDDVWATINPESVDWDGDGLNDLILGMWHPSRYGNGADIRILQPRHAYGRDGGHAYWLRNVGTKTQPRYAAPVALAANTGVIAGLGLALTRAVDWDGDGDLDLTVAFYDASVRYFENVGTRTSPRLVESRLDRSRRRADLLGDRVPPRSGVSRSRWLTATSISSPRATGSTSAGIENTGSRTSPRLAFRGGLPMRATAKTPVHLGNIITPSTFDVDGDGTFDLLSGNEAGLIVWSKNTGTAAKPVFGPVQPLPGVDGKPLEMFSKDLGMSMWGPLEDWDERTSPVAVDWDGDGLWDVVTSTMSGRLYWIRNAGTKQAPRFETPRAIEGPSGPLTGTPRSRPRRARLERRRRARSHRPRRTRRADDLPRRSRQERTVKRSVKADSHDRPRLDQGRCARHESGARQHHFGSPAARRRRLGRRRQTRRARLDAPRHVAAALRHHVVPQHRHFRCADSRRPRVTSVRRLRPRSRRARRRLESGRDARRDHRRSGRTRLAVGRTPVAAMNPAMNPAANAANDTAMQNGRELEADVVIIGGGVGGCGAALAAAEAGVRVILTEESDWIGGQLTTQITPPDEHGWIERFGCTASYRKYRDAVRAYYREHYPLTAEARANPRLNPGNGWVSPLCHEPRVALAVLQSLLAPHVASGQLRVLTRHALTGASLGTGGAGDTIAAVAVQDLDAGVTRWLRGRYFLDATELGDLIAASGAESVTGAESQADTGEPSAPAAANPTNAQAFSVCCVFDHREGEDHTIERPARYDYWRDFVPALTPPWTGRLLSWTAPHPRTMEPITYAFAPNAECAKAFAGLWSYRRILDRTQLTPGAADSDLCVVNWVMLDHTGGDLVTASAAERRAREDDAREQTRSVVYWLQTEAPRADGGAGWPGLRLRGDVTGTDDGLAKSAYVRESRRLRALTRIVEPHVSAVLRAETNPGDVLGERYADSVGIGFYRIDLHPSVARRQLHRRGGAAVSHSARRAGAGAHREPDRGRQEHRHDARDQRMLSSASGRVEHRRGGGRPGGALRPRTGHPATGRVGFRTDRGVSTSSDRARRRAGVAGDAQSGRRRSPCPRALSAAASASRKTTRRR